MTADFSRLRMNPLNAFSGVELQQGRVLLDGDHNEGVAILDRRLRALASDVLGRSTVSQTTPLAFRLTPAGAGFTIGRGRLYVDGLLAENFGVADPAGRVFDPLMAETVYSADPAYDQQPWLQPPPALPTTGRHLVYLDVWTREVTPTEDPQLIEPALGVDTTVRRQTVWQVRVLADEAPPAVTCDTPDAGVPGWTAVIAPSGGRLSTGTYDVAGVPDPCELPPTGGYTGLENQLYRVEIHDPGTAGSGATFKWSRDNASVTSRVATLVSATELDLDSLGRDAVLRFAVGQWVEITDDARELAQAAGEMRRITEIDETNRRIRLADALPAAMLPAVLPSSSHPQASNLRVRRWDQGGEIVRTAGGGNVVVVQDLDASTSGVIDVPGPGVTLLLENGVTVHFSAAGTAGFRAGDAWVFAARTADASVESLDAAAPVAIHHHYARLGFWDIAAGTISDCRDPWPPAVTVDDCGCTACVTAASHADGSFTLQDAVDAVREAGGGTVCVGIGEYALPAPLNLANVSSLRLKGQGPGSVLVAPGSALDIRNALGVAVQDLTLVSLGERPAIVASTVLGLALCDLVVAVVGTGDNAQAAVALAGAVLAARIERNLLLAPYGVRALDARSQTPGALLTAALRIEDNVLWCDRSAVLLDGPVFHLLGTRVAGNQVLGCRNEAISLLGYAAPGAAMQVLHNVVQSSGSGVRAGVDGLWIEGNQLSTTGARSSTLGIELLPGLDGNGSDQCQLLANQVSGYSGAAIVVRSRTLALIIKLNILADCANGIVMLDDAQSQTVAIENNQLRDIGEPGTGGDNNPPLVVGIGLSRVASATVAGNTLHRVGAATGNSPLRAGVMALAVDRLRLAGNQMAELSPASDFGGLAVGVYVDGPFIALDIRHNQIERDTTPSDLPGRAAWVALMAGGTGGQARRLGVYATVPFEDSQTLVFNGSKAYVARGTAMGGAATVAGNTFAARSNQPLVQVLAQRELLFTDNRCEHRMTGGGPAVQLQTVVAIVNGNRVQNNTDVAISVQGTKSVVALGNITTGILQMPGLGSQFEPLNLRG
jgi:hypothetical protein